MKQSNGWWFPDNETHFVEYIQIQVDHGKAALYQEAARKQSLKHVKLRRTAIDIGGHVGTWSKHLSTMFEKVIAFEPIEECRLCFEKNVSASNVELIPFALGNKNKTVSMIFNEQSTGDTSIDPESDFGDFQIKRLDDFNFENVDYIKIDTEGYELYVLQGGIETIKRCKPIIVIEQKKNSIKFGLDQYAARDFLITHGLKVLEKYNDDIIMGW